MDAHAKRTTKLSCSFLWVAAGVFLCSFCTGLLRLSYPLEGRGALYGVDLRRCRYLIGISLIDVTFLFQDTQALLLERNRTVKEATLPSIAEAKANAKDSSQLLHMLSMPGSARVC